MTVADLCGPWQEPDWNSGLIDRLRRWWNVPVSDLPDAALALFLRQRVAVDAVMVEARRRLAASHPDDSESYEGELAQAVHDVAAADPAAGL